MDSRDLLEGIHISLTSMFDGEPSVGLVSPNC